MIKHHFRPLRMVLVPIVHGCEAAAALSAAAALGAPVTLVGLVRAPQGKPVSASVPAARAVRKRLRELTKNWPVATAQVRARTQVHVSPAPWPELLAVIERDEPDLLLLDWDGQLAALQVTPAEVLTRPPCNVAIVRGPVPIHPTRVLAPMRGGPHAELALRVGLSMQPRELTAFHLTSTGKAETDAPFRGLERVLKRLPEVRIHTATTANPTQMILDVSQAYDLVVMGATAQPMQSHASLGVVADRILQDGPTGVMVVKTRRPMKSAAPDETSGAEAISILVDKWFAEKTFHADEFADLRLLLELKQKQGVTISLALPALNEAETVGRVIRTVKRALMDKVPLLDEIVLIDSHSTDRTRDIARRLGVPVFIHQHLLPELGARTGKGEALWKSLLATKGDIIAWIDTDIVNIHPRFVYGVLGPLLLSPHIQFVKGFYRRPLKVGEKIQAGGGGRVTELTARPLLNLFYPELSGVIQPLSGEYAGRRSALEQMPFFSGYGVETGLLIEVFEKFGLEGLAQVDLLERIHHNQPLEALSKMSFAILQAVIHKLERRHERPLLDAVNQSMKLIRYEAGNYFLDVEEIAERERPPMQTIPEYAARFLSGTGNE